MLWAMIRKEWVSNLLELRFTVCALLCVFLGVVSVVVLRADLTGIKANPPVTAAQKEQLAKDLMAVAQGGSKPSQATAANLANGLAAAFAEKPLADKECSRLLSDLAAVLNPAKIQATQMQAIHNDIQAIFQNNGVARKDAIKLMDQVKAVGAETQKTAG